MTEGADGILEMQVAMATNAIIIPAKKKKFFSYVSYGTSQNPIKDPVKNRLLEAMVDYPTPNEDCKAIDNKMIRNSFGGFNKFFRNPNLFAPN